jgi:ABC-type sulfate transport system permease component
MEFDALHLVFYVVMIFVGIAVVLMLLKIAFRNLPLWLFELWPHLTGLAVGVALLLTVGWQLAAVAAAIGIVLGIVWTGMLERCRRAGPERSRLERFHGRLVKWAQK